MSVQRTAGRANDDGLQRHQFGGTFGGPIMRDKLFFFFGLQITDNYNEPLNSQFTVPTEEVLRGDFRRMMSSTCRQRYEQPDARLALREQPGGPGAVPSDLEEDHGDGAGRHPGERPGRLRPIPVRAAGQPARPADRAARRLPALAEQAAVRARVLRDERPPGAVESGETEPARPGRRRPRAERAPADNLDRARLRRLSQPVQLHALLVPAHDVEPPARRVHADLVDSRCEDLDLHGPAGRGRESGPAAGSVPRTT